MSCFQPTKVLMCPPTYFKVNYEINPWMDVQNFVDQDLAILQWQNLYNQISCFCPDIKTIEPHPDLPDLVFIDAGFLYKNIFIPSNFRFPERQPESVIFADWFASNGYEIKKIEKEFYFEGHGDTLWVDDKTVYCGHGFRSHPDSYKHIQNILSDEAILDIRLIKLTDPRFYHLDTCFCPINKDTALVFADAIDVDSLKKIKTELDLIEVRSEDALNFACNSLVFGQHIIMPFASRWLQEQLKSRGFHVHIVEVSEFIKAGGACKCLCMPL